MFSILKDCFTSPAGSFGFVFGIFVIIVWSVHWVTKKVGKITNDHGSISGTVTKMEAHMDEVRRDLSFLKGSIDVFRKDSPALAKSHSPVSLTDIGMTISIELGAETIIARNWDKIFADLEKNICNKNAYDIQQYCLEMVAVEPERFIGIADLNTLKEYAYKKGNSLQYYSPIFGILIRDKYLQLKGIKVSEVDLHDPNKKE